MEVVLSIDIGGTSTKLARVDQDYNVLDTTTIDTTRYTDEQSFFSALYTTVRTLAKSMKDGEEVVGVGIGAPGGIPIDGTILGAANLPFSERVEVVRLFEKEFDWPCFLTKDSYAAALGEGVAGAAVGMSNFVLITLGTGLGCGIVVDGQVVHGHTGQAGEIGHTISVENGRECNCGRRGCLETYVSASGICRTAFELMATRKQCSLLRTVPFNQLTAKMVFDAALQQDELAQEVFLRTGHTLGDKLAELVTIVEPEAIILAGGLTNAGAFLTEPAAERMEEQLLKSLRGKTQIMLSNLKVNEAALIGAAAFAWQNLKNVSVCQS